MKGEKSHFESTSIMALKSTGTFDTEIKGTFVNAPFPDGYGESPSCAMSRAAGAAASHY
jgi:hypothetical protein